MALRLPIATQSVRRASRTRRVLTILFASAVFVVLPLRLMLSVLGIATWTATWRTVDVLSTPFVTPFQLIGPMNSVAVRNATLTDFLALTVWSLLAIYLLALLTVRRQR